MSWLRSSFKSAATNFARRAATAVHTLTLLETIFQSQQMQKFQMMLKGRHFEKITENLLSTS
jgi:hypothetical protein